MAAILFVFFAEVAAEAFFFAQHLHHHDGKEGDEYGARLPSPQPYGGTHEINESSGQHRIAINLVRPFNHQVLRTRCHFMAKCIHRVALAATAHIDDCPDAQHKASKHHDWRHNAAPHINWPKRGHSGCKPHDCRDEHYKENPAQQVSDKITKAFHYSLLMAKT